MIWASDDRHTMNTNLRRPTIVIALAAALAGGGLFFPHTGSAQAPQPVSVQLNASRDTWTETATELKEGEQARITAAGIGSWTPGVQAGPEGVVAATCDLLVPGAPIGAALVRVGAGIASPVGSGLTVAGPGRVSLAYNDCPGQFFDNMGGFAVQITPVLSAPAPVAATTEAQAAAPAPAEDTGKGTNPVIVLVPLLLAAAGGAFYGWRRRARAAGPLYRFSDTARLDATAWVASLWLNTLQGERRPKRFLTIGGPDQDIDFGLDRVWATLAAVENGGARIDPKGEVRVLVNGLPIVVGQRLADGARVTMGPRDFVYHMDPVTRVETVRRDDPLSRRDPRLERAS